MEINREELKVVQIEEDLGVLGRVIERPARLDRNPSRNLGGLPHVEAVSSGDHDRKEALARAAAHMAIADESHSDRL